ncbi:pyridoxal-phosphate dependent enzyme, partial [Candidatus Bipolaricaulota bacterium]|nr:pyridoxal-phosphate dependent enzyme [Candidatus Bipolaricaulota bacterium]
MADLLWEEVILARKRIAPFAHRTPFLTCTSLDRAAANNVFFKCECLQKSGSFKFRGACNAIAALTATERTRG